MPSKGVALTDTDTVRSTGRSCTVVVALALVAAALIGGGAWWWRSTREPELLTRARTLRVGMTPAEVEAVMGKADEVWDPLWRAPGGMGYAIGWEYHLPMGREWGVSGGWPFVWPHPRPRIVTVELLQAKRPFELSAVYLQTGSDREEIMPKSRATR